MNQESRDNDAWVFPIVRQYLQTAQSGFPYISCPDELRPKNASFDSWWVIYSPSYDGGVIVEGYLIEEWRERQRKVMVFWSIFGILGFYFVMFSGLRWFWMATIGVAWIALLPLTGWLSAKLIFAKREWVFFPEKLKSALETGADIAAKHQAEEHRKQALPDGIGKVAGKIAGGIVETVAGKAVGQFSEMALEDVFKRLAYQLLHK